MGYGSWKASLVDYLLDWYDNRNERLTKMIDIKLLSSLKGSDCIDDVCETIGKWADNKYADVCQQLDEANETIASLQECIADGVSSNDATTQTVEQYEYEIKGLETTISVNRDREILLVKDYNDLLVRHEELKSKCANTVPFSRYDAMLCDYIDLVSKVKKGTALEYIMGRK